MSLTNYQNPEFNFSHGGLKKIFFQDVRNVVSVPRPRNHQINGIELGNRPQLPGIQVLKADYGFESGLDGWTIIAAVTHDDGKLKPSSAPATAQVQTSVAASRYSNYCFKIRSHNENGPVNGITVAITGNDDSATLLNETFTSFPGLETAHSFNAGNNTGFTIQVIMEAVDITAPFYIESMQLNDVINLFEGVVDLETFSFREEVSPESAGRLSKQRIAGFFPGNSLVLDRLFAEMSGQAFIVVAEDDHSRIRIIGSLDSPARFSYIYDSKKLTEGPAGYTIQFNAQSTHSAYEFTGLQSCVYRHSLRTPETPWLRSSAFDADHVTEFWETTASEYYELN